MTEPINLFWWKWQRNADAVEKRLRKLNEMLDQVKEKQICWIEYLQRAGVPLTDEMKQALKGER